jgi:tetratricopeptide (TPR) repeat protein
LGLLGLTAFQAGDHEVGLTRTRESMALQEKIFGSDSEEVAHANNNLAFMLATIGEHDEAIDIYRGLLEREEARGDDEVSMAQTRTNLAVALRARGDAHRALDESNSSVEAMEKTAGPDALILVTALHVRSEIKNALGQYEEGLLDADRAIRIAVAHQGDDLADPLRANPGWARTDTLT